MFYSLFDWFVPLRSGIFVACEGGFQFAFILDLVIFGVMESDLEFDFVEMLCCLSS